MSFEACGSGLHALGHPPLKQDAHNVWNPCIPPVLRAAKASGSSIFFWGPNSYPHEISIYQLSVHHMRLTHSLHDDHPVSKWLLLLWVSSAKIGWSSDSGSRLQMRVSKAWTSHWCQVVTLPGWLTNLATICHYMCGCRNSLSEERTST